MFEVTDEQIAAVRQVPHFAAGHYADLDIRQTFDFYRKRYVDQLGKFRTITS